MKNKLPTVSISRSDANLFNIVENSKMTIRITDIREKCSQTVSLSRTNGDLVKVTYREFSGSVHYAEMSLSKGELTLDSQVSADVQTNSVLMHAVASDILTILGTTRSTKYLKVTRTHKDRKNN